MHIQREAVVSLLREQGEHRRAEQAEVDLPIEIDLDSDERLLRRFGLRAHHLESAAIPHALAGG